MKPFVFCLLLIFSRCTSSTDNTNTFSSPLSANLIRSVTAANHKVSFVVSCTIPEPCWEYLRTDQDINSFDVYVTIVGKRITTDPCLEVLSSLDTKPTIIVPKAGAYTFHFWSTNETSIDTTIVVP
jgi:hypothetical protein